MPALYELPQRLVDAVIADNTDRVAKHAERLPDNDRPGLLTAALSLAAVRGCKRAAAWLLENGADPNLPVDKGGETPFHRAAEYGIGWAVELMLKNGADPDKRAIWGDGALHAAVREGHVGVVRTLLAAGADPKPQPRSTPPLLLACERGHASIAALLVEAGAEVNTPRRRGLPQDTFLHHAARSGSVACVELLLKHGADPLIKGAYGRIAVEAAARAGHPDIVRLLETAGGPAGRASSSELEVAETLSESRRAVEGIDSDVQQLIERSLTGSKIHDATALGQADKVRAALDAGVDADLKDRYGFAPLHKAAQFGHLEVIRVLVAAGANVNLVTKTRSTATPLHYAAGYGQPDAVKLLLSLGADSRSMDGAGKRPLDWATSGRCRASHRERNAISAGLLADSAR
jgi:ankyrin repeat protein